MKVPLTTTFGRPINGYQISIRNYLEKGSKVSVIFAYLRTLPLRTCVTLTFSATALVVPFVVARTPLKVASFAAALLGLRFVNWENRAFSTELTAQRNEKALIELLGGEEKFKSYPVTTIFSKNAEANLANSAYFRGKLCPEFPPPSEPITVGVDVYNRPFVIFHVEFKPSYGFKGPFNQFYLVFQKRDPNDVTWVLDSTFFNPGVDVDNYALRNNKWIKDLIAGTFPIIQLVQPNS